MGEEPASVHWTGCPSIDVVAELDRALPSDIFRRYGGVGPALDTSRPYLIVLQHPVTTEYGRGFDQIRETIEAVVASGMQAAWLWPNIDAGSDDISKGLRTFREQGPKAPIHFYRNFPVEDYARLLANAACIVGNSSSGIREGAFLGTPAINVGSRQGGREHGPNVCHVAHDRHAIREAIRTQTAHGRYASSDMFGDGKAGTRIAALLATSTFDVQKRLAYVKS
jgi:UDP-hydrolysing UDP-N-acetyl-D-glucosamine 2-epimerase